MAKFAHMTMRLVFSSVVHMVTFVVGIQYTHSIVHMLKYVMHVMYSDAIIMVTAVVSLCSLCI